MREREEGLLSWGKEKRDFEGAFQRDFLELGRKQAGEGDSQEARRGVERCEFLESLERDIF